MPSQKLVICFLLSGVLSVWSCEIDQMRHGCKIQLQPKACVCGVGCKSEFKYSNKSECRSALEATGTNICSVAPCMHGGSCIQISRHPRFKCRCESTGYYGIRCEKACPNKRSGMVIPYECIEI